MHPEECRLSKGSCVCRSGISDFVGGFWMRVEQLELQKAALLFLGSSDSHLGNSCLLYFSIQMKISHFKEQLLLNQPVISHFIKLNMPPVSLVQTSFCKISLQVLNSLRKPTYNLQLVKQPLLHVVLSFKQIKSAICIYYSLSVVSTTPI